jgi:hypothetical protein
MTNPDPAVHHDEDTAAMLARVGISVTDEGKARVRAELADAAARRTPERRRLAPPAGTAGHHRMSDRPVQVLLHASAIVAFTHGCHPRRPGVAAWPCAMKRGSNALTS